MTKVQKDQKMKMLAYVVIRDLLKGDVDPHTFIGRAEDAALDLGLIVIDDEGLLKGVPVVDDDSRPDWYL